MCCPIRLWIYYCLSHPLTLMILNKIVSEGDIKLEVAILENVKNGNDIKYIFEFLLPQAAFNAFITVLIKKIVRVERLEINIFSFLLKC